MFKNNSDFNIIFLYNITPFNISNADFFINDNKIDLILLSLLYFIH